MPPRFSKIMSKMQDEEDIPADIPNPEMYMPEPDREITRPFPPGVAAQEAFDDMLTRRIVDPLAQAGYPDLGAGFAAIPSAAHSMIVPQTDLDVAGTIIPLPGVAKLMKADRKAFPGIAKAMRAEKKAKDLGEYSDAIKALRGDDPDLGAIKVSPDIKITPGMAQKNYMNSRGDVVKEEQFFMGSRPMSQNPRSTEVTGIRGGMFGTGYSDHELNMLLNLNKDIPGLKKLIEERNLILGDPTRRTTYTRETPGLRRIEAEIASVLKANKDDLKLPLGYESRTTKTPLKSVEPPKIPEPPKPPKGDPEALTPLEQSIKEALLSEPKQAVSWNRRYREFSDKLQSGSLVDIAEVFRDLSKRKDENDLSFGEKKMFDKALEILSKGTGRDTATFERDFLQSKPSKSVKIDNPKPPKGTPEASSSRFPGIQSQLDVAPSRMDETGRAFNDVGQSDFLPYEQPAMPRFEDVQKRNYVESEMDPKEKLWKEIVASDPYINENPQYVKNLRNYFDNRWEQAQGTVEGRQIRMDLPKPDHILPSDEMSISGRYADELAFKKFAKPYDKTRQAERPLERFSRGPNRPEVEDDIEKIDDKITSHFEGYEVKNPGRKLQDQMYKGRPSFQAEQEKFGKVKEAMRDNNGARQKFRILKVNGDDVTRAFGVEENMAGMTQKELQDMVDPSGKRYRVVPRMTPEEEERLLMEKLKDWGKD